MDVKPNVRITCAGPQVTANNNAAIPASVATHGGPNQRDSSGRPGLQMAAMLLPTPHANCSTGPGTSGRQGGMNLQTAVALLPTPTQSMVTYQDFEQAKHHSSKRQKYSEILLPTPKSGQCGMSAKTSGRPVEKSTHLSTQVALMVGMIGEDGLVLKNSPGNEWTTEPPVCGRDDGIPSRVARLKALGNAVVPQIPEILGRAILHSIGAMHD